MDPLEFEELVAEIWEAQGWETTVRSGSHDRGIDVFAKQSTPVELAQAIQVKRYAEQNKVGSSEVRNYATLYQQNSEIDSVVVVTTSSFTAEAERLAQDLGIKIIDIDPLIEIIGNIVADDGAAESLPSLPHSNRTNQKQPEENFPDVIEEYIASESGNVRIVLDQSSSESTSGLTLRLREELERIFYTVMVAQDLQIDFELSEYSGTDAGVDRLQYTFAEITHNSGGTIFNRNVSRYVGGQFNIICSTPELEQQAIEVIDTLEEYEIVINDDEELISILRETDIDSPTVHGLKVDVESCLRLLSGVFGIRLATISGFEVSLV